MIVAPMASCYKPLHQIDLIPNPEPVTKIKGARKVNEDVAFPRSNPGI